MEWREWRLQDVTAEDSWLTLIDYHWMNPPVSLGARPGMNLRLPRGPERLGMFFSDGSGNVMGFAADSMVSADGVPTSGWTPVFKTDGTPVVFRYDDLSWFVRDFQDRLAVRVRDNRADLRVNFPGLEYYDVNPEWRLQARYEPYDPPKRFPVAIFTGGDDLEESPGRVVFQVDGTEYSLDVTDTSETGYFVIFSDETSGLETYPAGRYVWFDKPGEGSDRVILDFNKSYNPPCAFTEFATCPLPPRSHHIEARINAGELRFRKS